MTMLLEMLSILIIVIEIYYDFDFFYPSFTQGGRVNTTVRQTWEADGVQAKGGGVGQGWKSEHNRKSLY